MARIGALAERLRRAPVVGRTREPGSAPSTWRVDVGVLIALVNNAGSDAGVYRELDAAARAVLEHRDGAPAAAAGRQVALHRRRRAGAGVVGRPVQRRRLHRLPPGVRHARAAGDPAGPVRGRRWTPCPTTLYAPFTVEEWTTSPVAEFDDCVNWPSPVRSDPPITGRPPLVPPTLPVLVLSGGLDTLTTWTDGAVVAEQLGPSARWVKVENTIHVTALADPYGCASGLVRQFVRQPERLHSMDVSCASRIPEVRVVGDYPRRLSGATPATPRKGNQAGSAGLRLAAVGAAAVGDAIAQWWYLPGSRGHGLRGGWFTAEGDTSVRLDLHKVRFVADTVVDGRATWNTSTGQVSANVKVKGPGGITTTLRMRWDDLARHPRATLTGRTGSGARVSATLPAP